MISISPYNPYTEEYPDRHHRGAVDGYDPAVPSLWLDNAVQLKVFGNARSAIMGCLNHLQLSRNDEVCIETSSNGPYISSCVTKTIESVCSWSRVITESTRLVVVIHEFGFPCELSRMRKLRSLGVPILEDCAYAVGSRLEGASVGRFGDFAVYSFPKYYPVRSGGILVARERLNDSILSKESGAPDRYRLSATGERDLLQNLFFGPEVLQSWAKIRRDNWTFFVGRLAALGVEPYFELDDLSVPGVFVCKLPDWMNGPLLKSKFVNAGIEATEYYGHGGFYFPVHQALTEHEIHLMLRLFEDMK